MSLDYDHFACFNEKCPDFGKPGLGNIRFKDKYGTKQWTRLRCTTCNKTFSERKGTPLFRLHISEEKVVQILSLQSRGTSVRATAEAVSVDPNTVLHVVKLAGEHAAAFHEHMVKNLKVNQVQADEIYTYVKKRRAARRRTERL